MGKVGPRGGVWAHFGGPARTRPSSGLVTAATMGGGVAGILAGFPSGLCQRATATAPLISSTMVTIAALRIRYPAPDATAGITSPDGFGTGGAPCGSGANARGGGLGNRWACAP